MRFQYDEKKNRQNLAKHDIDFPIAELVFDDPYALTMRDAVHDQEDERYITLGEIAPGVILFVVHNWLADESGKKSSGLSRLERQPAGRNKAMKKLTKDQKRQVAAIAAKKGAEIDLSEMPEVLDWSGAEIGKFYRPAKKPITIRLDTDIVEWLKSYGRGYQTKVNLLLRHAMQSSRGGESRRSA